MKVIKLQAENVKRIKAVEIEPGDDPLVVLAGANAQGKTSVLDSIALALGGRAAAKDVPAPIREGEETAQVILDLGNLVVHRKWKRKGDGDVTTSLVVSAADGARYTSPQTMLDDLIGRLSFDPLEFANMPAKEQVATLLSVVDLPVDPGELTAKRQGIFEQRTGVNRRVRDLEAEVAALGEVDPDLPEQEEAAAEIAKQVSDAVVRQQRVADAERAVTADTERVEALRRQLADAEAALARSRTLLEETRTEVEAQPSAEELQERLRTVEDRNAAIRRNREAREKRDQLEAAKAESQRLTDLIADIDRQKAEALASAKMPVDGLSFDDDGVTYQGVPFAQCSAAERLRVSMAVAMALNPTIRVVRITDGSLLDSSNMKVIEDMAREHDFQVWVERVDETGQVGVVIEDGQVKA